ncbi:MAG TPA: nucleotidyltransferase family protein [Candidatus Nanoarchaeia archaeon]|nr:nucleotidyltransferase family protein [Candidatus Nanoarchaeia archaeon]
MQAVILAAGRGTRLQPLTDTIPKAMVKVNGKPMLQIVLEQLKTVNVKEVVIIVHYLKEKIIDYFGNGSKFGLKIKYVEQKEMKGTADAVAHAEPHITDDKFWLIFCDSLFETDQLTRILEHKDVDGVFTCKEVEDGRAFGILVTDGKKVTQFIEKPEHPPTNLASFSVFMMPKEIFEACKKVKPKTKGELWLTDAIQILIDSGKTFSYEKSKHILDIGTHEQLAEAQELAKKLGL